MYEKWDINRLTEECISASPEKAAEMMLEISRRYREGIGVSADPKEAERWASDAEKIIGKADNHQRNEKNDILPKQKYTKAECEAMSDKNLFHAYREGAPWAIYYFSLKLVDNNEDELALSELEELSYTLENEAEGDSQEEGLVELLCPVKTLLGRIYERKGNDSESIKKAIRNYEDASDLGYREAIPGLLRCYRKEGYENHEAKILQLLRQLEDGDTKERTTAAEVYLETGRKTYATMLFKELLDEYSLTDSNRLSIMESLLEMEGISDSELEERSANGDGAASWALGKMYDDKFCYKKSEECYKKAIEQGQDATLELKIAQDNIEIESERAKKEEAHLPVVVTEQAPSTLVHTNDIPSGKNRSSYHDQGSRFMDSCIERAKKFYAELKVENPIFAKYLPIGAVICLALLIFSLVSTAVSSASLEPIDPFEDIQVNFGGASPDAWVDVLNNSTDDFLQTVTYTSVPSAGLKNGDVVKVTATYSKDEARAAGYKLTNTTKTYKVDNLDSYVTDISQIDETCRAAMEQQARDMAEAAMANYSSSELGEDLVGSGSGLNSSYGSFTQTTSYFLSRKHGYTEGDNNRYIVTYEVPVTVKDFWGKIWDGPAYISVVFYNLSVNRDGITSVVLSEASQKAIEPSKDAAYKQRVSRFKDQYIVQEYNP